MNSLSRTLVVMAAVLVSAGCTKKKDPRPGAGPIAENPNPPPPKQAGPGDGGGGTDVAFDFQTNARRVLEDLPRFNNDLKDLNVKELEDALSTAKILVTEEPLVSVEGNERQDLVAKSNPDTKTITIHGSKWKAIYSHAKKESLALHELLVLKRIESSGNYKYSQLYYESARPRVSARFRDVVRPQVLNELEGPRIVVTVFTDFLSPYYWKMDAPALQKVIENYADKVQVVVRNFPITVLHGKSEEAALAGICAAAQGKFRLVHDAIISKAAEMYHDSDKTDVKALMKTIAGLDVDALETCMTSTDAQIRLDQDMTLVDQLKLMGAPSHIVSSRYEVIHVGGARDYDGWKKIIDKMLEKNTWD